MEPVAYILSTWHQNGSIWNQTEYIRTKEFFRQHLKNNFCYPAGDIDHWVEHQPMI